MALKRELNLPNKSTSKVYLNTSSVKTLSPGLENDFKNIINDLSAISKSYQAMAKDKNTRGAWQDVANRCTQSCQENAGELQKIQNNLQSQLMASTWDYMEAMLKLNNVADAASNL